MTGAGLSASARHLPPVISALRTPSPPLINSSSSPSTPPALQSCVRARPFKMLWSISVEMAEKFLLKTLVANFIVLTCLNLRHYGERFKPLPLQLWVQIFMILAGYGLTKGVSFVGISYPIPFVICCTAYSVYGVWNLVRRGPEDDFREVLVFNVVVAAMGKLSEYLV